MVLCAELVKWQGRDRECRAMRAGACTKENRAKSVYVLAQTNC
jgi:hypothetical protein